jgi:hypothetical protein
MVNYSLYSTSFNICVKGGQLTPLESEWSHQLVKLFADTIGFVSIFLNLLECQPYMIFKYGLA